MKPLLFTFGLTYGGALVSLFRPYVGFLIYVCYAIIKPEALWGWAIPQGNYSRIIAIALLVGWALNGRGQWQMRRASPIVFGLIGFWLALLVGAITAPVADLGWSNFESMSKVFLPWLIGLSLIDSGVKLRQLAWVIVISQGYLAYEFNLLYYEGHFVAWEFYHGGLDNNGIAITMDTAFGLAFFLGMHAQRWWQKAFAFAFAALMAHAVLFSNSRGGMLALIVTGVICFLLIPKKPKHYLIFTLMVLLVFRLAGENVQKRFFTAFLTKEEGGDEGTSRKEHWAACIQSMIEQPFGVGANCWPVTAPKYGLPRMAAHCTWLQMGAELGLQGLFCLLGLFYGMACVRLWPLSRERSKVDDPWFRILPQGIIASVAGFAASAQFVTADGVELPYYVVLVGAGVLKLNGAIPASRIESPPVANFSHNVAH
jgi:putative inorganic carbon (hco3(-)) transporter